MMNADKQYLISIKSIFEAQKCLSSSFFFLQKLSDKRLANRISNEIALRNYGRVIFEIDNYLYEKCAEFVLYDKTDIKAFDFDYISIKSIEIIKEKIGIANLQFNIMKDKKGNDTSLLRHWDNESRFAIIIEKKLSKEVEDNPKLLLDVSKEIVMANLGFYTKLTIKKHEGYQENQNYGDNFDDYDDYYNNDNWLKDAAGTDDPEAMNDAYWNMD